MGILEVKGVNKRFGGLQALGDVNLSVAENTVHAIIGPNGAGKSTLLNCLVGKLIPDTGSVMFDGSSVLGRTRLRDQPDGHLPGVPDARDLRRSDGLRKHGHPRLRQARRFALPDACLRKRRRRKGHLHPRRTDAGGGQHAGQDPHAFAASLSRGDKRRLEMAMCLLQEPRLLLLDEPTAGMARADTNNTIDLLKEIKEQRDITICIIEHDMHVVFSLADRITVLAQGTPAGRGQRRRISVATQRSAKPISARRHDAPPHSSWGKYPRRRLPSHGRRRTIVRHHREGAPDT